MPAVADPNTIVLAGDVLNWATAKTNALDTLLKLIASVMVILAVLMAYWRTKSWVATLVAVLLGALVLWAISNMTILQSKVGSEVNGMAPVAGPPVPGLQTSESAQGA